MTYRIGLGSTVSADPSEIRFTDHGRESNAAIVIDSTARDADNTPTTTLRKGLVLGKVTATGKYKEYDSEADDGTETARVILDDEVNVLDAGAKADLTQCVFDEDV